MIMSENGVGGFFDAWNNFASNITGKPMDVERMAIDNLYKPADALISTVSSEPVSLKKIIVDEYYKPINFFIDEMEVAWAESAEYRENLRQQNETLVKQKNIMSFIPIAAGIIGAAFFLGN